MNKFINICGDMWAVDGIESITKGKCFKYNCTEENELIERIIDKYTINITSRNNKKSYHFWLESYRDELFNTLNAWII